MATISIDSALLKARSYTKKGELDQARSMLQAVLDAFPNNKRARSELTKLETFGSGSRTIKHPPKDQLDALIHFYNQGHMAEAVNVAQNLIGDFPTSFILWNLLGAANTALGNLEPAVTAFNRALAVNPNFPDAYNNLGNALNAQGKLEDAISAYQTAIKLNPKYTEAYNNLAAIHISKNETNSAIVAYKKALAAAPHHPEILFNLGLLLHEQGYLDQAADYYFQAIKIEPQNSALYYNLGNTLYDQGKIENSIEAYRSAIALKPNFTQAHKNMGVSLQDLAKYDEAISAYAQVIALKPDHAEAHYNMGNAHYQKGEINRAISAYNNAIKLKPDYPEAYFNLGLNYQVKLEHSQAIASHQKALEFKPDHVTAETQLLHQKQHICDFTITDTLKEASTRLGITTNAVSPFAPLSWVDDPQLQFARSKNWVSQHYHYPALPLPKRAKEPSECLKVGYFSADFFDHATMYLMAGLLREHDKKQFQIYAYSYGFSKSGEWRARAQQDVDQFFDVTDHSDQQIVELARSHNLDIAIDLKGHTMRTRSGIFQYRLAPIQVNYLGYPGSLGAGFIDYIIADPVVIPENQHQYYSEKIIYLPHSYQPNDNTRAIPEITTTRCDVGLPDRAFVFCCFNNSYKISPNEFDIWIRLLRKVDNSVLWLLQSNKWAECNLHKEAENRGIDPSRIIFAEKLPHQEHLARHKHADLFIDTFNVNAHTTASDALWGGLPVVTKQGQQFAARVAASLLTAVGLPELITETETEYENLILELATNPQKLSSVKQKLRENRLQEPLFDTKRYTQNFEHGLIEAYNIYRQQKPNQNIYVED
jgi:protein O-GlcNAc transferase